MASASTSSRPQLKNIDITTHTFSIPGKRIHTQQDVNHFLTSPAYDLITSFIIHLNASVSPLDHETNVLRNPADYTLTSPNITVSQEVQNIIDLIYTLESFIEQAPPDPGPRRFGNVAFRKWHSLVEEALSSSSSSNLLDKHLPPAITSNSPPPGNTSAKNELLPYLLGSFGSPQRLDYGTGHELSFAAFLCCIWVLGGFTPDRDEPALTLKCFDAYFHLVRKLVLTYTLEPAGSHGVWGLDDHAFLPYIFGSAELTTYPPTSSSESVEMNPPKILGTGAAEGFEDVPKPGDVVKNLVVERERGRNLYFGAVGFIYDVKKGPFWEHSPILYDISGVQGGWGKINKGMLKMYNAEVLGKFPVVQHFPFGSIFSWGTPSSTPATAHTPHSSNIHTNNNPRSQVVGGSPVTAAPWANKSSQPPSSMPDVTTRAPWANNSSGTGPSPTTRAPWANSSSQSSSSASNPTTRAPWAKSPSQELRNPLTSTAENILTPKPDEQPLTTAPWAAPRSPHSPSARQLDREEGKVPWATGGGSGGEVSPPPATEANLGPRRTSSPDSKLAASLDGEEAAKRRGSLGTGGVRVAETGDLRRKTSIVRGEGENK